MQVLPEVKTVLHSITRNFEFVQKFCDLAQKVEEGEAPFYIPFIDNIDGETALHKSLKGSSENTRVAEYFFKDLLPGMPLDHHGRAIEDIIPECIEREIRYLGEYLDSRFVTTNQLCKVSRADYKTIKIDRLTEDQGYFVSRCDMWPDERLITERIFDDSKSGAEINV